MVPVTVPLQCGIESSQTKRFAHVFEVRAEGRDVACGRVQADVAEYAAGLFVGYAGCHGQAGHATVVAAALQDEQAEGVECGVDSCVAAHGADGFDGLGG